MRVVVLGVGGMGRVTAQTIGHMPLVQHLVVADVDGEAAQSVATSLGMPASAIQLDISNKERLHEILMDADIVLNTVGPFYKFGILVLQAAIATKTHYADLNDDWQPTIEMLALHRDAQAAGMTALVGLGASPGISNLLALKAASRLDQVDVLLTGWDVITSMTDASFQEVMHHAAPSAALIHWLHQTSGYIRIQQQGKLTDVKPLQKLQFEYPGRGAAVVWTVGHPEPLTLTRRYPNLRYSANVMAGNEGMMALLQQLGIGIDAQTLSVTEGASHILETLRDPATAFLMSLPTGIPLPSLFAVAMGRKDRKLMTVATTLNSLPPGGMGGATGIPLALAVPLFAQGRTAPGVFAPEDNINPDDFFDLLAPYTNGNYTMGTDLLNIAIANTYGITTDETREEQ